MRLYDSLRRRIEEVVPVEPGHVRMYSCGPTVYRYAHLGNLRTFMLADLIRRALELEGLRVTQIMNITDVGHMTDESSPEAVDKMLLAVEDEGLTALQIAEKYTRAVFTDAERLGIRPADVTPKATEHIDEMIELTEALTAIDVNTGSFVGTRNLEETILKTNLEAVKEIAYQLRFRNLGGLIVIDFIDMERKSNREKVFTTLKEGLTKDKAKTHVLKMSELGLIEMTRKRTRENLNRLLSEPCFYCEGRGSLKAKRTICYEVLRDLERETNLTGQAPQVSVHVHPDIARVLKEEEQQSVIDLERRINRRVVISEKENLHIEQYEISS